MGSSILEMMMEDYSKDRPWHVVLGKQILKELYAYYHDLSKGALPPQLRKQFLKQLDSHITEISCSLANYKPPSKAVSTRRDLLIWIIEEDPKAKIAKSKALLSQEFIWLQEALYKELGSIPYIGQVRTRKIINAPFTLDLLSHLDYVIGMAIYQPNRFMKTYNLPAHATKEIRKWAKDWYKEDALGIKMTAFLNTRLDKLEENPALMLKDLAFLQYNGYLRV